MTEASSGSVGPIVFSNETARSQLVSEGVVVTFRSHERTVGDSWWRKSRTGEKEGNVHIKHVGEVDPSDSLLLSLYADDSGFDSTLAWKDAIRELNGGEMPDAGHLYIVSKGHGSVVGA